MSLKAQRMSVADYLAMDECHTLRHEYVDGNTPVMSGASLAHNLILVNLVGHVWQARSSHGCRVFTSGMKVRIDARERYYYPDVVGCCDPRDGHGGYLARPCFVIEVLSPSTGRVDHREKRVAYGTLKSLDEYVIVDQDCMRVTVYQGGVWPSQILHMPEDVLKLTCVGLGISLKDVYAGVELPASEVRDVVEAPPAYVARATSRAQ